MQGKMKYCRDNRARNVRELVISSGMSHARGCSLLSLFFSFCFVFLFCYFAPFSTHSFLSFVTLLHTHIHTVAPFFVLKTLPIGRKISVLLLHFIYYYKFNKILALSNILQQTTSLSSNCDDLSNGKKNREENRGEEKPMCVYIWKNWENEQKFSRNMNYDRYA